MHKTISFWLLLSLCSTQVLANDKFYYQNNDLKNLDENNSIQFNKTVSEGINQPNKYEPNGSAAKDAINLALAPEWAHVSDNVDRERAGYNNYEIYCFKDCKNKHTNMDAEFSKLADKFKK